MVDTRVFKQGYFPGKNIFGDDTNNLTIDDGVVSMNGTSKRSLTLRPEIDFVSQIAHAKPTQVALGVSKGYSMPVFAADDEELFFSSKVPYRWDGESDIKFEILVALSIAEDVGDNFKLQFSWENNASGATFATTSNDVPVEQAVLLGRAAQYDIYSMIFTIDYDIAGVGNEISVLDLLSGRLRRIAATEPQITGEVILIDWWLVFNVNKNFGLVED